MLCIGPIFIINITESINDKNGWNKLVFSDAAQQAYANLRTLDDFQWYVIPLLVIVIYVYSIEIGKKNWTRIICGVGLIAGEFIWEMFNALVCHFSGYSGLWVTPGKTAYLILVGFNIEIAFFFALVPIIAFNILDAFEKDETIKILGRQIPNRILIPLVLGAACVFIEVLLNQWGYLVWDWTFWNWPMIPLIVVAYTLPMFFITWMYDHQTLRFKTKIVVLLIMVATVFFCVFSTLGWV